MDKEMIYNAIVKVDDDLIDRSLTRKPNKKTKATIILSGSCIAIAACFVLVAVISGVIPANRNHSLSGLNELISKNLDASISMDWPYYKTAEEARSILAQVKKLGYKDACIIKGTITLRRK